MNDMVNYVDEPLRMKLIEISQKYNDYFVGKELTYIYRDGENKRKTLVIKAQPQNFMHLCGIKCYGDGKGTLNGISNSDNTKGATLFFKDCLVGKIKIENIYIGTIQSVQMKLHALSAMDLLFEEGVRICPSGVFERLAFERAIKTSKTILAITLINSSSCNLVPNSAINLQGPKAQSNSFIKTYRVTSIKINDLSKGIVKEIKFNPPRNKKKRK